MTKADFIKSVAEKVGCTQKVANDVVKAIVEVVVSDVRDNNGEVVFNGLGTFKQKATEARVGKNPLNGQTIQIQASKTIQFKVAPSVKIKG